MFQATMGSPIATPNRRDWVSTRVRRQNRQNSALRAGRRFACAAWIAIGWLRRHTRISHGRLGAVASVAATCVRRGVL